MRLLPLGCTMGCTFFDVWLIVFVEEIVFVEGGRGQFIFSGGEFVSFGSAVLGECK